MTNLPVKIKKLSESAIIPGYATSGSAGMDLVATSEKIVIEGTVVYIEYGTSLAIQLPTGFCALLLPRSSVSSNTTLVLANSMGLIDADYVGEIKVRFKSLVPVGVKKYKVGDRIAQLMVIPYPKIDFEVVGDLDKTERGDGGFGSTNGK